MTTPRPEAWQTGPVEGVPPMLQPVAHALLNSHEQLHDALNGVTPDEIVAVGERVMARFGVDGPFVPFERAP